MPLTRQNVLDTDGAAAYEAARAPAIRIIQQGAFQVTLGECLADFDIAYAVPAPPSASSLSTKARV